MWKCWSTFIGALLAFVVVTTRPGGAYNNNNKEMQYTRASFIGWIIP